MATSEVIKLKGARLSFAKLFSPKSFREGQEPRYEATFLLDPSDKEHAEIIKQIKREAMRVAKEHWGDQLPKSLKKCYGSGDEKDYDGYEGMFYIATSNRTRPTVVDRDRTPLVAEDGKPYSGSYVIGSITLWTQDNEFGKRVNANLRGVQFLRGGEPFGQKPVDANEEFEDLADGDSATGDDADSTDDDFLD